MLPASKHNLLSNPSPDLLSFHLEADKALQEHYSVKATESSLSKIVERLWTTYKSLPNGAS
jgi:hypothetical protein